MATVILGIASGILGIVALLLKYYPDWRKKRDVKKKEKVDDEELDLLKKALLDGDSGMVSRILSERMRRAQGRSSSNS